MESLNEEKNIGGQIDGQTLTFSLVLVTKVKYAHLNIRNANFN